MICRIVLRFCPFVQQQSYLRFYLPFWFYLIIPLCTTDRPLLATHPMILISWKRPAMNLSFFCFLEESWFWTEGERGLKQVDKRISFQSLCLDLQLKFDQYLSLICVCIYSSRFFETFEPLGPLNLGTIVILYGANIPKYFSTSVLKKRTEAGQWSEL